MNFQKFFLPLALFAASFFSTAVHAALDGQDNSAFNEELNEDDFDALRAFIKTKRAINIKDKATCMKIAGDVRSEWRHLSERGRRERFGRNHNLRGANFAARDFDQVPISRNDFDIEFNLYFSYECDRAWAVSQLQFDNSAGVFDNGTACVCKLSDKDKGLILQQILLQGHCQADPAGWHGTHNCRAICLKKAYFGYNLFTDCDRSLDIELGRRRLSNVFDSKIQFSSPFDGILFTYEDKFEWGKFYSNLAGFVVNERVNHLGWVTESGALNICDSGFDVKYSFIDWRKNGRDQCYFNILELANAYAKGSKQNKDIMKLGRNPIGFNFLISQFTVYYHLDPECYGAPAVCYAAFLINHARSRFKYIPKENAHLINIKDPLSFDNALVKSRRANIGWYVGFKYGEVVKEGDWSIEVQYNYVQAIAVPDGDVRGIGRGNVLNWSFTNSWMGNTNFKGFKFEGLYAITNNLTINPVLEWSTAIQNKVGGHHHYSCFKMETVYAF